MKNFVKKILILITFYPICLTIIKSIFSPILYGNSIVFPYAVHPFDIAKVYPNTWNLLKTWYLITFSCFYFIFFYNFISMLFLLFSISKNTLPTLRKNPRADVLPLSNNTLNLFVGYTENKSTYICENGLFQNILITGTIGSGKTSSAMYPFTKQIIEYQSHEKSHKISLLVLDVKGNYHKYVRDVASNANRLNDIIVIDLSGNTTYNPLDKPNLTPIVLANRLKTILMLFSPNNQESFWLDKAEQILAECIKFCRLYNDGYVSFLEIHKLIFIDSYFQEKLVVTKDLFQKNMFSDAQIYDLLTCIDFFEKEFFSLDSRTISILRSEISRITSIFISDYSVSKVFCPQKKDISFHGFEDAIKSGKIVVLNINIAEYKNLSKIIACYLKLDFQSEVLSQLKNDSIDRKTCFISDEFHEYVTNTDADFFAQSREAKCINIVATQSYTSLRNTLKDDISCNVVIQSLVNKLWFRTDDMYTIEEIQKQIGKEDQEKISKTISENAKETKLNLSINSLISSNSSISESINKYTQKDYIYDTSFFSQKLDTFNCLGFISDGNHIFHPQVIKAIPYFKNLMKGEKMKKNKILYSLLLSIIFISTFNVSVFAADPKLITTIDSAFKKIEGYIVKISTPAAAVAIGTGVLMKKFSFGDEEKIRTANKLIKGSLFSYAFILCIDLVLSLFQTLLT